MGLTIMMKFTPETPRQGDSSSPNAILAVASPIGAIRTLFATNLLPKVIYAAAAGAGTTATSCCSIMLQEQKQKLQEQKQKLQEQDCSIMLQEQKLRKYAEEARMQELLHYNSCIIMRKQLEEQEEQKFDCNSCLKAKKAAAEEAAAKKAADEKLRKRYRHDPMTGRNYRIN